MSRQSNVLRFGPISAASPEPLYEQVVMAVKREVADGRLAAGDALPSVRILAADLLVSLITVKRAYEELARDGVIYSRQGLGAFVADAGAEQVRSAKRQAARDALRDAVAAQRQAGLTDEQLIAMLADELGRGKQQP